MARSHHGNTGLVQQFSIAAYIKDDWRIVDFFEAMWVEGVVHGEDGDTGVGSTGQLLSCQLGGLAGGQRLRRDDLNSSSLQFRQGGTKYGGRRSEMLDQFS